VRLKKGATAFSLYLDFGGCKWFEIYIFRSVVDYRPRTIHVIFSTGAYLLLPTFRHWWLKSLVWSRRLYVFHEQ